VSEDCGVSIPPFVGGLRTDVSEAVECSNRARNQAGSLCGADGKTDPEQRRPDDRDDERPAASPVPC